jgi:hypothetical protein
MTYFRALPGRLRADEVMDAAFAMRLKGAELEALEGECAGRRWRSQNDPSVPSSPNTWTPFKHGQAVPPSPGKPLATARQLRCPPLPRCLAPPAEYRHLVAAGAPTCGAKAGSWTAAELRALPPLPSAVAARTRRP